jgi:hypothetical protein
MSRQRYLPTFKHKTYAVGANTLAQRPEFLQAIGMCIATWSYVDNEVSGLFGILLTTGSEAAHRVFQLLRRWSHQRDALRAAAQGRLKGDAATMFRVVIDEYCALEGERNFLAHSCFGTCDEDKDLLFAIGVDHHVLWQADVLPKHFAGIPVPDPHEGLKKDLFVYRMRDFQQLHKRIDFLLWDLFHLNAHLRNPAHAGVTSEFRKRFGSVRVQKMVANLKP